MKWWRMLDILLKRITTNAHIFYLITLNAILSSKTDMISRVYREGVLPTLSWRQFG